MGDPRTCGYAKEFYGIYICKGKCAPCEPDDCFEDYLKMLKESLFSEEKEKENG